MQYYSYVLKIRDLHSITFNNYGRLFQEYAVDMFTKVEVTLLRYLNSTL